MNAPIKASATPNSRITSIDDDSAPDVATPAAAVEGAVVVGKNHDSSLSGKRATVTIHPTNDEGGGDAVFVSVNGYAYQVPRGTPQNVPVEVLSVLKNTVQTLSIAQPKGGVTERDVHRFGFHAA